MGNLIRKKIGNEVYLNFVREEKFKSDRITVNLVTPLCKEKAAVNALVPFVLRKGCKSCPDFTELNKRLAKMYGAILDADVTKQGGFQIIEVLQHQVYKQSRDLLRKLPDIWLLQKVYRSIVCAFLKLFLYLS